VKLKSKNLDAIIVNKIGDFNPISNDFNQIDFINSDLEITPFERKHKKDVSLDIMETIYNNNLIAIPRELLLHNLDI
jgi:phosphopantothenoylcysteine synthetase/decarboxylase